MIEAPEARILCRQLNETVRGKKITDVYTQFSPHKFAWFTGSSEEYAEQLSGKTIDHAQSQGGMVEITASYPAGVIGTTLENLDEAAQGEYDEWQNLYPAYSEVAKQEGFSEIARQFAMIAEIERTHMERFRGLYDTMKDGHIFVKEEDTVWRCMECGHIYIGKKAPNRCPVCQHPQALFEIKGDRY